MQRLLNRNQNIAMTALAAQRKILPYTPEYQGLVFGERLVIGPVYRENCTPHTPFWEENKEKALEHVLRISGDSLPGIMTVIGNIEVQVKAAYADHVVNVLAGPELQKIMVVDGCFFLLLSFSKDNESLRSSLQQIQRLLESPKQQLLCNRKDEDYDGVEDLVYEADDLVDKIIYDSVFKFQQQQLSWYQKLSMASFFENLFEIGGAKFPPKEELADLTRRIRLVNARSLSDAYQGQPQGEGLTNDNLLAWDDLGDDKWDRDDFVVGREDATEEMISRLLSDEEELRIIGIWGMGGIGKTTLAKKLVYQDCSVRTHFERIGWATVGKDFRTRNVLEDLLLQHLFRSRNEMMQFSDLDLAQKLYEFLQHKKYLIVLDDIWSTDAWECLRIALPSRESTGSRVLLTTRFPVVAAKIASSANSPEFVHQMRGLNQDEGWELLRKNAFRGHYPSDFKVDAEILDIGKDIVNRCQGLPLAISVIGGLLMSKPTTDWWKTVHRSIVSSQTIDQGPQDSLKLNRILSLSYDFLPTHLKPCFLYLGTFPEDVEIETERLYLLWMAGGFISSTHGSSKLSMTKVAEQYLNELVIRNLVSGGNQQLSAFRKLKSCHVHDVLRDFCLSKANDQNFYDAINFRHANDEGLGSCIPFSTTRIYRLTLSFEDGCVVAHNWNTDKQHPSISIHSTSHDHKAFSSTGTLSDVKDLSRLRALYLSGFNYKVLRLPSVAGDLFPRRFLSLRYLPQVLSDLTNLKRLRVLAFSSFNFDLTRLPTGIEKLFRLRYLSLRDCNITRLPSTIGNLLNLETLDLGEGTWIMMLIPNELRKLSRLRHLYLPRSYKVFEGDKLQLDGLIKLETLVNFDSRLCRVRDLFNLTKLQKLVATIDGNFEDLEEATNCLDRSLNCLRSLHVRTHDSKFPFVSDKLFGYLKLNTLQIDGRIGKLPPRISQSLTEISLINSKLCDDPMEKLEKLPKLWVLELHYNAFLGKHMTCSGTGMPQLKFLSILNLRNLEDLTIERGGMPKLSTLVLEECQSLTKLPEGLSFLTSLQELRVAQMPPAFMDQLNNTGEDFPKFQHAPAIKTSWSSEKQKMFP